MPEVNKEVLQRLDSTLQAIEAETMPARHPFRLFAQDGRWAFPVMRCTDESKRNSAVNWKDGWEETGEIRAFVFYHVGVEGQMMPDSRAKRLEGSGWYCAPVELNDKDDRQSIVTKIDEARAQLIVSASDYSRGDIAAEKILNQITTRNS